MMPVGFFAAEQSVTGTVKGLNDPAIFGLHGYLD